MKTFLTTILLCMFFASSAQNEDFVFADIPWGSTSREVEVLLAERGFSFFYKDETFGDSTFSGQLLGVEARVVGAFNHLGRLVRTDVYMLHRQQDNNDEQAVLDNLIRAYYRLREGLVIKYGEPRLERNDFPLARLGIHRDYSLSDVQELRSGLKVVSSSWGHPGDGVDKLYTSIRVEEEMYIRVSYVSADWIAEYERRVVLDTEPF